MKKIIILIISVIFVSIQTIAQITIADNDGNDLTNQTAFLPSSPDRVYFNITNNGSSAITFIVEVTALTIPGDATAFQVCACGSCVILDASSPTLPFPIGDPTTLDAGATYGNDQADVEYISNGSIQAANITIKVYEEGNETNSAEFTLDNEFNVKLENIDIENILSIYPNPASEYFILSLSEEYNDSQIVISNIIGKVIRTIDIKSSENRISADKFSKGIYFVSLVRENTILFTRKIILN